MLKDYEKLNYNKKTYEFRSLSETYEIIFKKYSSRTALVCGDRIVKYDELDKITNKIKSYLFKNLDTEEEKARLEERIVMGFWETLPDGRIVMRIATSWATVARFSPFSVKSL